MANSDYVRKVRDYLLDINREHNAPVGLHLAALSEGGVSDDRAYAIARMAYEEAQAKSGERARQSRLEELAKVSEVQLDGGEVEISGDTIIHTTPYGKNIYNTKGQNITLGSTVKVKPSK